MARQIEMQILKEMGVDMFHQGGSGNRPTFSQIVT